MTLTVRQQCLEALDAALAGMTVAGATVTVLGFLTRDVDAGEMPAVARGLPGQRLDQVFSDDEQWVMSVPLELAVKAESDPALERALDELYRQVHDRILADITLGGVAEDVRLHTAEEWPPPAPVVEEGVGPTCTWLTYWDVVYRNAQGAAATPAP